MSVVLQIVGWCCIAVGAWATLETARALRLLIHLGKNEMIEPALRRRAWSNALTAPLTVLIGVNLVTFRSLHGTLIWLPFGYAVIVATGTVASWFWRRKKVRGVRVTM